MKKCPHCGKLLEGEIKWYHHPISLIIGFLVLQPFILPAVWSHPRYSARTKSIITVVILVLTCFLFAWMWDGIKKYFDVYNSLLKGGQ